MRTLWRMNFPDKKQYVVYSDKVENTGMGSNSMDPEFYRAFEKSKTISGAEIERLGQMRTNMNRLKPSKRTKKRDD